MNTERIQALEKSKKRLEEVKLMYKEMQQLMIELRTLGELALDKTKDSEYFKELDLRARPIIERYVELQGLIPNQAELAKLQSDVLMKDEAYGYLQ